MNILINKIMTLQNQIIRGTFISNNKENFLF